MPIPERLKPTFASLRTPAVSVADPLEEARKRLIVALDVPDAASAAALVARLIVWFYSLRKSRGAKSFRSLRHVSHSCAVPGDEK